MDDLVVEKEEKKIYPDIPAEIPGVPLVEGINSGALPSDFKDETSSLSDRIAKAAANTNPSADAIQKDRGVSQDDVIDLTDENPSIEPEEQPTQGVIVKDEFGDVPGISEPPTVPPTVPEPEMGRGKRARKKACVISPKTHWEVP